MELTRALILTLCVRLLPFIFSTAQTIILPCTQFGMKLGSENITIMSEASDDPDVPQGKTVYTRAPEKKRRFEIYRQYIGAGYTRSALAWQQSFEKVPISSVCVCNSCRTSKGTPDKV